VWDFVTSDTISYGLHAQFTGKEEVHPGMISLLSGSVVKLCITGESD
jgi:hypothetical protein